MSTLRLVGTGEQVDKNFEHPGSVERSNDDHLGLLDFLMGASLKSIEDKCDQVTLIDLFKWQM